ncbi:MAG: N,N-dimethylformamidase beta subunit family domain-containing protein, partial [Nocardioidaceae bacterium]
MGHEAARQGCAGRLTLVVALTCLVLGACNGTRRPGHGDTEGAKSPTSSPGRRDSSGAIEAPPGSSTPSKPLPGGTRAWRLTRPARQGQIEGFATASSGLPGTLVGLRISTTASTYRVRAYRFGAYDGGDAHAVWASTRLPGARQPAATFADHGRRTIVAPWRTSVVVDTGGWAPGLYVFKLVASTGWQAHVPYVVSSLQSRERTAVVFPVTTWQAYNDWGGYSLYKGPAGDRRSWAVSFDRPYPAPGAGEMLFGAVPVAVAAERLGIPLAWFTNVDLDRRPDALVGAAAYVSSGHDEYWTAAMRGRVRTARGAGTNLAFLGANTMYWRVRLEDDRRVVVGYRTDAVLDPASPAQRTGLWRDAGRDRAESELTGMQYECF